MLLYAQRRLLLGAVIVVSTVLLELSAFISGIQATDEFKKFFLMANN